MRNYTTQMDAARKMCIRDRFADCRIVECVKQMNVCTCLNPFYTRLAIFTSIVFGQDLSKTELAEPVIGFLKEMLTGPHAVRKTLEKYLGQ